MYDLARFGERLKQARESRNLTQEEVVERFGRKDATAISEYENGKRRLAAFELADYAAAIGVPITYFFEEVIPEDELEFAVIEWFRTLPDETAKRRVFQFIQDTAPFIIGGGGKGITYKIQPPIVHSLNEKRGILKRKK
jgi:transcriptional regulator with XRE-family HTH domain